MELNPYPVKIKESFHQNLEQIFQYLLKHSYQSGVKLKKDIVEVIATICERPESMNIAHISKSGIIFRYCKVIKSYKVYFCIDHGVVTIIDILHEKRDMSAFNFEEES